MEVSRRNLIKMAGVAAVGAAVGKFGFGTDEVVQAETKVAEKITQAPVVGCKNVTGTNASGATSKVYFTKHIDAEHLIQLYQKINSDISGKIAIKLHTGEPHGPNILPRDMVQAFQAQIPNSTIIEANVAYGGARSSTSGHRNTLQNPWDGNGPAAMCWRTIAEC